MRDAQGEPLAIVGIGCRFAGVHGPDAFWKLLRDGRESVGDIPPERFDARSLHDASGARPGSIASPRGGFLSGIEGFDPFFFGISPREASAMDPQQRLFLEVAWEAFQQSGHGGERRTREIGVWVGCEHNDYSQHFVNAQHFELLRARLAETPWFQALSDEEREGAEKLLEDTLRPSEMTLATRSSSRHTASITFRRFFSRAGSRRAPFADQAATSSAEDSSAPFTFLMDSSTRSTPSR